MIDSLRSLYPNSRLTHHPIEEASMITFPYQHQWLSIPKKDLSEKEQQLLQVVFLDSKQAAPSNDRHPWYGFLFLKKTLPLTNGNFRVIQFILENDTPDSHRERKDWLKSLSYMFNEVADAFFVEPGYALLIEKETEHFYHLTELEGILKTLETEHNIKAKAFAGTFFTLSDGFPRFFQEEKQMFLTSQQRLTVNTVVALPQLALTYLTEKAIEDSLIMQVFKKKLSLDEDMALIISALWKHQGNISSTAKELFMHRNTLQYRIDKFYDQTNLSLKNMDDLVLAYLLVH
ncbi:MAG: helix-turn-helix domain-containing protein [Vagococcus sp.]|nr:helix-turn-helix domain-containing protein [Vagococcus sp.]